MTLMYKNKRVAKVLKTSVNIVVMFEFQTRFFTDWNNAIHFLLLNGYSF